MRVVAACRTGDPTDAGLVFFQDYLRKAYSFKTMSRLSVDIVVVPCSPQSKRNWYWARAWVKARRLPYSNVRLPQFVDCPAGLRRWGTFHGLSSRSGSGSNDWGAPWYATGRRNRPIAAVPTDVLLSLVVAGHGPPCCMAGVTATPVGQPPNSTRPVFCVNHFTKSRSSGVFSSSAV